MHLNYILSLHFLIIIFNWAFVCILMSSLTVKIPQSMEEGGKLFFYYSWVVNRMSHLLKTGVAMMWPVFLFFVCKTNWSYSELFL